MSLYSHRVIVSHSVLTSSQCANVMLRILENRPSDVFLPVPVPGSPDSPLKGQLVLDVSAGGGLCSIGAAVAGATVIATDIPEQLDLLQLNVEAAAPVIAATGAGGSIRVSPLFWGAPLEPVIGSLRPRVAILSDLLFIALRDGFTDVLIATLVSLARSCDCVLFGFEERLIYEETEFMDNLTSASAGALAVIELKGVYASKAGKNRRALHLMPYLL